jgi:hypothetical protein
MLQLEIVERKMFSVTTAKEKVANVSIASFLPEVFLIHISSPIDI